MYAADTYPTIHHLRTPFVPATDIFPLDSMEAKRALLPRVLQEEIVLLFDHDTTMPFARIKETAKKLVAEPVGFGAHPKHIAEVPRVAGKETEPS